MISFTQKGDFRQTELFLKRNRAQTNLRILQRYAEQGVAALRAATPVETGKTANSWDYTIESTRNGYRLVWNNTNIVNGVPIAVILQYGHGTRNGGYVEGRDYINPALRPIFEGIARDLWEEVRR